MKKFLFLFTAIILLYSFSASAGNLVGTVSSVNNSKKEITVKIKSGKAVKM